MIDNTDMKFAQFIWVQGFSMELRLWLSG